MAGEANLTGISLDIITELGKIGLWVQAIGLFIILWFFFEVISLLINKKRMDEIYKIKHDMKRIELKIDKIIKKNKIK